MTFSNQKLPTKTVSPSRANHLGPNLNLQTAKPIDQPHILSRYPFDNRRANSEPDHSHLSLLPRSSHLFPFTNIKRAPLLVYKKSTFSPKSISISDLTENPNLSDFTELKDHRARAIKHPRLRRKSCCPVCVSISVNGSTAHQANRDLRAKLASDLQHRCDRPAFQEHRLPCQIPRADDIEAMMAAYPGLSQLDYANPPKKPFNELDPSLWLDLHSKHCSNLPPCTRTKPAESCYFKPMLFMLTYGFHAPVCPAAAISDIAPHSPAYVSLWNRNPARCAKALEKLMKSTKLQVIKDPELIFPLLPVIRSKDLWRHENEGTDFKVRLTSDISTSGANPLFCDWKFKYLALHAICSLIARGDFLATRDITGFYNRLPAGEFLRRFQCFQDPKSYAKDDASNDRKVRRGHARILQQMSCMFGQKQLPAWASCVSSELARILQQQCIRVIALLIDDFLFLGPASEGPEGLRDALDKADEIMEKLGLPSNNKGQPPSHCVVFSGIRIDSLKGLLTVDEEQRLYIIFKLETILARDAVATKELESLDGSLGWICYVCVHGRSRRHLISEAALGDESMTVISKPLRKQLRWWLDTLTHRRYKGSRIFFRNEQTPSVLVKSDASGVHGFGFCAAGIHVTGTWSDALAPRILDDMFVKELLPITIATLMLGPVFKHHIVGVSCDNSGVVFRTNCGSCRNPLGRRLLQAMSLCLHENEAHVLADWNNREQPDAKHADDLSKIFTREQWDREAIAAKPWRFRIIIHQVNQDKVFSAWINVPRLAAALTASTPRHTKHF